MRHWRPWGACLGVLIAFGRAEGGAVQIPRQVLVVYSMGREFAPFNEMARTFRADLAERSDRTIEFHEATLETARSIQGANEQPLVNYLEGMFADRDLHLVVALGGPATLFVQAHRERLFPEVPLVATLDVRRVQESVTRNEVAVVPLQLDPAGLIEDILQPLPATTNVLVVLGANPLSRYWVDECRREFARFTNRVAFTYSNDLSLDEIRQAVQQLPPNSSVLYGGLAMDAAGVPHEQETALTALREVSNAPMFGVYNHQLGLGIVGGRLVSMQAWGERVADAALRVMDGEPAGRIVSQPTVPGRPAYDWRELQRWGIPLDRLPPEAEILFRPRGMWEQHRKTILSGVGLLVVETSLIAALILELRRRRQAEARAHASERAARALSGRLIHTQEEESRRIARDLHDDFNQRLALLSVEIDLLGRSVSTADEAAKLQQLSGHTRELASDLHRLAYRLHPAKLDQLGLVPAVSSMCRDLQQHSALKVHFTPENIPAGLPVDVARCLFRVAQESLQNVIRHSGAKEARIELTGEEGGIRLRVVDAGCGFDLKAVSSSAGLGLLSMRERVRLSQGRLEIRAVPGQGTQVELRIPLDHEDRTA
ncbi:MAG: sensor histidine kinase [Verrucomicrobiae bacterium]|nr:sensor histidine kinase [Verrucomicrobiae bacterium]